MPKRSLHSTLPRILPTALFSLSLCFSAMAATPSTTGDKLANDGDYVAAEAAFAQTFRQSPRDADTLAKLARVNLLLNHAKQAVDHAKLAIALQPRSAKYQLLLGDALSNYVNDVGMFSKLGIAHQIEGAYQQAVQLEPGNADARFSLAMFYLMAPGIAGGSDAKAAEQIATLDKLDIVEADTAQAQQAGHAKQYAQAETLLRKAAAASKDSSGLVTLGEYLVSHKQPAAALAAFQQAARDYPHEPDAYYQIGKMASEGKASAQAGIAALDTYLGTAIDWTKGDAPYSRAHYRLAKIRAQAGDADKAKAEYRLALKLDPGFKDARQELAKFGAN